MNPLGSVFGTLIGAIGGLVIYYLPQWVPQVNPLNYRILSGLGVVVVGWIISHFFDDSRTAKLTYLIGLLLGYFGTQHFTGTIPNIAPTLRPTDPTIPP